MFRKVLVANRGEIACRILATLRRLGIGSVAVYSDADRHAPHVRLADEAVRLGPPPAAESYLDIAAVLAATRKTGAEAVHPGYGFLSENAEFAEQLADAGIVFIGPTVEQLRTFGAKHQAREIAARTGVPLLPGTGLLADLDSALAEANAIGYPVMLKSTAGGGGIGLQICHGADELATRFDAVRRLSQNAFGQAGVLLEKYVNRARHIEVQLFGDGRGGIATLGERDCSVQRRNQKVVEETPAPHLSDATRRQLAAAARLLGETVRYASAGTVEFIVDVDTEHFYFLEVNTRLQVEHGVTELVWGVDVVELMLRQAAGELDLGALDLRPAGHAIEVRVYAENPARQFQPSAGLITNVQLPDDVRCDGWVETGTEVTAFYDPLLVKELVIAPDRAAALERMRAALAATRIAGIETNLSYLRAIVSSAEFAAGRATTSLLDGFPHQVPTIDIVSPGTHTTVQEYPGRVGYWNVGIPPSGPMDDLSFRLGNRIVGNTAGTTGLECTATGPALRFNVDSVVALTGAETHATLDGQRIARWQPLTVRAGQVLRLGPMNDAGARAYVCVRGGLDVPEYLGSRATFTLGRFGGHGGRCLVAGDTLWIAPATAATQAPTRVPDELIPHLTHEWEIGVLDGPHGAPDFFTEADIAAFYAADWEVHFNSARTGVRLVGPKPDWARADGGEAGLHPSNIHDVAYAVGTIDFTGDMPIILGPDGPSLGGFVCPATIVEAERWKIGQLKPGDRVRFVPTTEEAARAAVAHQDRAIDQRKGAIEITWPSRRGTPILANLPPTRTRPEVVYRRAGDAYVLVEYGPLQLDLRLRFRVHALMQWIERERVPGVLELTPGIRSLQVHFDTRRTNSAAIVEALEAAEGALPEVEAMQVPTRIVHLPLSWDDPATQLAIERYTQVVRKDAPWTPSNIEFIRRINGLTSVDEVRRIVFEASYLVLGLGDVYLGAPVATPVDPRHRLVTTKYNPARTWTPENAVGIGGAYLCIYGMEGPGGYQFVGRTLPVYNRFRQTREFVPGHPWLLRFFDQIRWYPVSASELLDLRADFLHGRHTLQIEEATFRLSEYSRFLEAEASSIAAFKQRQQAAFDAERERWQASGQMNFSALEVESAAPQEVELPEGCETVDSPLAGSVWQIAVAAGDHVPAGAVLAVLESMKMEVAVEAPHPGVVERVIAQQGASVSAGQPLLVLRSTVNAASSPPAETLPEVP